MDARTLRCLTVALLIFTVAEAADAGSYQTVNFAVSAKKPEVAEQVGKAAEVYRRQLAVFWLGKPLPNWSRPCKITVDEGTLGAGGQTTFQFVRGEVLNWRMHVQGSIERILDSVLPHEINHTIFACHFRRPLPRWADEGAATLFEHRSEQLKQLALLNEVIRNRNEIISLRDLLAMKEYPKGQRPMLTLYAQGYALADFLVQQKGRHAYLRLISDAERGGWEQAIRSNFDHAGIESLERNWRGWVLAGMPKLTVPREQMLAANENESEAMPQETARPELPQSPVSELTKNRRKATDDSVVRSQSPDARPVKTSERLTTPSQAAITVLSAREVVSESQIPSSSEHRRSSLEAPVPRPRDANAARQISNRPMAESVEPASCGADPGVHLPSRNEDPGSKSLFEHDSAAAGLEPTGLIISDNDDLNADSAKEKSGFEFSRVLLPVERNARSGRTPQWAGFPGQKKLF